MALSTNHPVVQDSEVLSRKETAQLEAHPDTARLAMVLGVLDGRYRENVANYAEAIHACNHEMEQLRIELERLESEREPLAKRVRAMTKETDNRLYLLEHLNETYIHKRRVLAALDEELQTIKEEHTPSLEHRYSEIETIGREISDLEIALLESELQKQNLLLAIEPIEQEIRSVKERLEKLTSQKRYIESSRLHDIPRIGKEDMGKNLPHGASGKEDA